MTKRGKKATRIALTVIATLVLLSFTLSGCAMIENIQAHLSTKDVNSCHLEEGKDVFALTEAVMTVKNPNWEVLESAGWTRGEGVRQYLTHVENTDPAKDNCVLFRLQTDMPGREWWQGYCMQWAIHIPYEGGDTVQFETFERGEIPSLTKGTLCTLKDSCEACQTVQP